MSTGVIEVGPHYIELPNFSGAFQHAIEGFGGGQHDYRGPNSLWWSDVATKVLGTVDKLVF